jgi:hypothetical protein
MVDTNFDVSLVWSTLNFLKSTCTVNSSCKLFFVFACRQLLAASEELMVILHALDFHILYLLAFACIYCWPEK